MTHFIFDVDGTLTPSRECMDKEFADWFEHFATHNSVYIVTGSDRTKTLEQIPYPIYNLAIRVYQCSGNDVWEQDRNIRTETIDLPEAMLDIMYLYLEQSKFEYRTGHHIDIRPGLVNFSVVGRGCDSEMRQKYIDWDNKTAEREFMADNISSLFPEFDVQVAGETGIDITVKGKDKSQILVDFDLNSDKIYFFGDKMEPGGNDYSLGFALATKGHDIKQVKDWRETWQTLKGL